jgi:hypothetical protein
MTKNLKQYLIETSLSRLYSKTQNHAVGAITAFRGSNTREQNKQLNKKLLAYLLDKGYSVTKIKGSYIEQYGTDQAQEVGEESFFVANPVEGDDNGQLQADLIKLGAAFDQDSIMSYTFGGKPTLIGTSDREDSFPGKGQTVEFNDTNWGYSTGEFFSRVKGRQFSFAEAVEMKKPDTINGIRAMKIFAKEVRESIEK